jgi:hypothetical protein
MAITFGILILVMTAITLLMPLKELKALPTKGGIDQKPALAAKWLGLAVVVVTIALYIIFW